MSLMQSNCWDNNAWRSLVLLMVVDPGIHVDGLNLDPLGGGPLEGWPFTGCAIFAVWRSEMTWLTSWTGTIYLGLSFLTLSEMVLKEVHFWDPSPMVLKEVDFWDLWLQWSWKNSAIFSLWDGLERKPILVPLPWFFWKDSQISYLCLAWSLVMVLKEVDEWSWKDSDLLLCFLHVCFAIYFQASGLERNLWSWCLSCFLWLKQTWKYFCIIHEWDLTLYLLGVQLWSPLASWSLQHRSNGLERTYLSSAGVSVWYCHDLPASHHL